jgi:hypothetical protein
MLGSRLSDAQQHDQEQNASPEQHNPPASPQGQASSDVAVHGVTGCLVQSGQGYVLMTENDAYPIDTDKDLSQFINKRIKITGIWEYHSTRSHSSTGEDAAAAQNEAGHASNSAESGEQPQAPSDQGNPNPSIAKELRLRMIASVIGDCNQTPK